MYRGEVDKDKDGNITWNLHLVNDGTDKGVINAKTGKTDPTGEKVEEPDSPKKKLEGTEPAEVITEETEPTGEKTKEPDTPRKTLSRIEPSKGITEEIEPSGEKSIEPEPDTLKEKLKGTEADPVGKTPEETIAPKEKPDKTEQADENAIKKVTTYFTHLTAVLKFITHLGIHEDKPPLTVHNYGDMRHRKWRTARIGAFGTNISILLMK